MSDFEITVDGIQVPVTKGQTVLQAALAAGIEIPVFCWHPQLDPVGACRICLVEIEKFPKLQVACATKASEGMVVQTKSPKVVKARQGVIEFILANHPLDCPTCDKGGECDLQDTTFKYGLAFSRMHESKHRFVRDPNSTFDDLRIGPEIIRNQNRCICCYRCTRLVNEAFMEDDLGAYQRGHLTEILPPPGKEIRNLYSGNTVEYCPVGALTNTDWRYEVRVWLTKQADVICPHCPDGCNLKLWTFHDKLFRATGRTNSLIDNGLICDIGRYGYQYVFSPDRVKSPMIKKQGELVEVDWNEALAFIKTQTDTLKSKLSGSGFFGMIGDVASNEEIYAFQRLMRRVIGTNNVDHRLSRRRKVSLNEEALARTAGSNALEFSDIEKADVILVLGSDLHSENPITALRLKKAIRKHGAKVILANPRPTPLGIRASEIEAVYKPGTEVAFLLGLIDAMIASPGLELSALGLELGDVEDFKKQHSQYARGQAAGICGVPVETMENIAELLSRADNAIIIAGQEIARHPYRDSIHLAASNLKQLCKHASFLPLPSASNSRGAEIFGARPDLLPGKVSIDEKSSFEDIWKGPISDMVGKDSIGILDAIIEDEIECGFIFGSDPMRAFPDANHVKSALEGLQLMVVIDSFMTDTARAADVILPLSTFAETEGTRVNWEGRLQFSGQAVPPRHQSKPGCEIVELLSDSLGVKFGQPQPADVYKEMVQFLPVKAPESAAAIGQAGLLLRFNSTGKKEVSNLVEIRYTPPPEDDQYPLTLLVGNADHHHGALTEKNESLLKFTGEPFVGISRNEADKLGVADGDLIRVESKSGKVVGKAVVYDDFPDGRVLLPENFGEMRPNLLMGRKEKMDLVKLTKM